MDLESIQRELSLLKDSAISLIQPCTFEKKWIDRGLYWENTSPQRSQDWLDARFGRLTASNLGAACGLSNFSTPTELALDITGLQKKVIDQVSRERMDYGTQFEDAARQWFERTHDLVAIERGLCVPKDEYLVGASSDGEIGSDGLIEIKCPRVALYKPLKAKMESEQLRQSSGFSCNIDTTVKNYNHIWTTHMAQMYQNMSVTDRKYCYYVVYCPDANEVYEERIDWDEKDTVLFN